MIIFLRILWVLRKQEMAERGAYMQIHVEFIGPIQRGNWEQKETISTQDGNTLAAFLVEIGYLPEHLTHILVIRNDAVTRDFDGPLADGDTIQLSVLLGGG